MLVNENALSGLKIWNHLTTKQYEYNQFYNKYTQQFGNFSTPIIFIAASPDQLVPENTQYNSDIFRNLSSIPNGMGEKSNFLGHLNFVNLKMPRVPSNQLSGTQILFKFYSFNSLIN
jgi:hypothetical protein